MRIIAGSYRSRKIYSPPGLETRPTLDSVRESLFNILGQRCMDARVLDLFAGSGALGLEAISRGAKNAVFCDVSQAATVAIRLNIDSLGLDASTRILRMDWQAALIKLSGEKLKFDIVFLDPPYKMPAVPLINMIADDSLLEEDALLILEHDRKAKIELSNRFCIKDCRRYGDTCISFIKLLETCQEMGIRHEK